MNTARTIQVLDANNNNISPATCIDSLYFEIVDGETTYRMAVRDKFVLAGNLVSAAEYREQNLSGNIDTLALPFVSAQAVPGTDQKMHRIDMGSVVVGDKIKTAVENYINNTYLKIEDASAGYFIKSKGDDDSNLITNAVGLTDGTNRLLTVGNVSNNTFNKTGLLWDVNNYVDVSNNIMNIHSDNTINVISETLNVGTSEATNVSLGNSNAAVDIIGNNMNVSSGGNLNIKSADTELTVNNSSTTLSVRSNMINLNTGYVQIGTDASANVTLKGKIIPDWPVNPDEKKYLIIDSTTGELKWEAVEKTTIIIDDSGTTPPGENETQVNFRKLEIMGLTEPISLIKTDTYSYITFKNLHFEGASTTDKSIAYSLGSGSGVSTDIKFKTVGEQSLLIEDENSNIDAVLRNTDDWKKLTWQDSDIASHYSEDAEKLGGSIVFDLTSGWKQKMTNISVVDSGVSLSAQSFYMTSDEQLKENITQLDDDRELPKFVSFNYKEGDQKTHYGVIAQDVIKCGYSELTSKTPDGYLTVDYTQLLCLAVARLQKENDDLKKRVEMLEQR